MHRSDDPEIRALTIAFQGLAIALIDQKAAEPKPVLDRLAMGVALLMEDGEESAAHALREIFEPVAIHYGFRSVLAH